VSGLSSYTDEAIEVAEIERDPVPDVYPIRQEWTFVIPPTPTDLFVATKER
jgi:hypothetical protein